MGERERKLQNDKYDEAVEVSQSMDQSSIAAGKESKISKMAEDSKTADARILQKDSEQTRSRGVLNKPFDEALEFSQSGSDDSVDTRQSEKKPESGSSAKSAVVDAPNLQQSRMSSSNQQSSVTAQSLSNFGKPAPVEKTVISQKNFGSHIKRI